MRGLVAAGLRHHWRSHAAVVAGVATATAVLAGSLVVGDSVRGSLRETALGRLGRTVSAVTASRPFAETAVPNAAPVLALRGSVARQDGSRRAAGVLVYGVDRRFFDFHGVAAPVLAGRTALLSPALADELGAGASEPVVVLVEAPSDIPGSVLFGRRDEPGRRLRVTAAGVLPRAQLGEFALQPTSDAVRAVFLPLEFLQGSLDLPGRVTTVLATDVAPRLDGFTLDDVGLRLRDRPERGEVVLESASALLDDATVAAATRAADVAGLLVEPALVYVATALRVGDRAVPYSMVLARPDIPAGAVALNGWAAGELRPAPGDGVVLEYDVWQESGHIAPGSTTFRLDRVLPMEGDVADPALVPPYPGITESAHIADWDPPFPVDLTRIRPQDEAYWERWRTAPKAVVNLGDGQRLWGHRLGRVTSLRFRGTTRATLEPLLERAFLGAPDQLAAYGVMVQPVREQALQGSRGSTDFGEYFLYFSFFLAVSALMLAGLFFRLNLEQRLRELGLLKAVGYGAADLRRLFLAEAGLVAGAGALLGALGALGWARLVLLGLRTIWSGAVGTQALALHVAPSAVAAGAVGALAASLLVVTWTLRGLGRRSARSLLSGDTTPEIQAAGGVTWPAVLAVAALGLGMAGSLGAIPAAAAFFGSGGLLLVTAILLVRQRLRRPGVSLQSLGGLGWRGAAFRPGRSVVSVALVAFATFVIVAVGAFKQTGPRDLRDRNGASGGYTLLASSTLPVHHDLRTPAGRAVLGLGDEAFALARFRRSEGEDASCLNLYRPGQPALLGAEPSFLREGRFSFADVIASTDAERANPWLTLLGEARDGAVPVVADATTLQYVLHKRLGDVMPLGSGQVRFVAALRPGVLQGALVTSEPHFQALFPREEGYRFFLVDPPVEGEDAVTETLESQLADFGLDVSTAAARLDALHRVENTYIATFQALGALGLLLGTVGVAAVLLRNGLERRRELALLRAIGYRDGHVRRMLVGETVLVLLAGLAAGVLPALVAILPALRERPGAVPLATVAGLVVLMLVVGTTVSLAVASWLRRLPLLSSLRSE